MAANRVIGRHNALPWRLPADLRRFKTLTMGHPLILGRKTFQAIGRPLPGRRCIVLTRDRSFAATGVEVALSLDEALALTAGDTECFIAGGGQVYQHALAIADRIYLTVIEETFTGDVRFPHLDARSWHLVESTRRAADSSNPFPHSFHLYERVSIPSEHRNPID